MKKNTITIICITLLLATFMIAILISFPTNSNNNLEKTKKDTNTTETTKETKNIKTLEELKNLYHLKELTIIDDMNDNWKTIQSDNIDKFADFIEDNYYSNSSKEQNITDTEIIRYIEKYILTSYYEAYKEYPSIVCSKKEDFMEISKNIFNRDSLTISDKICFFDVEGYYCNCPGGDSSGSKNLVNREKNIQEDITTYKNYYEYIKYNETINYHIEIRMKKVDNNYHVIYIDKIEENEEINAFLKEHSLDRTSLKVVNNTSNFRDDGLFELNDEESLKIASNSIIRYKSFNNSNISYIPGENISDDIMYTLIIASSNMKNTQTAYHIDSPNCVKNEVIQELYNKYMAIENIMNINSQYSCTTGYGNFGGSLPSYQNTEENEEGVRLNYQYTIQKEKVIIHFDYKKINNTYKLNSISISK